LYSSFTASEHTSTPPLGNRFPALRVVPLDLGNIFFFRRLELRPDASRAISWRQLQRITSQTKRKRKILKQKQLLVVTSAPAQVPAHSIPLTLQGREFKTK
jgi:hypothetical protein